MCRYFINSELCAEKCGPAQLPGGDIGLCLPRLLCLTDGDNSDVSNLYKHLSALNIS